MRIKRVITILNDLGRVELDHGPQQGEEYEHAVRSNVSNEVTLDSQCWTNPEYRDLGLGNFEKIAHTINWQKNVAIDSSAHYEVQEGGLNVLRDS
ncbi:hypothetical protein HUJ04_006476 [Dendroctonus ponderosae]|nr:hypothetical protein HUJ04_006476 [Dendroctonus ponderosae]